MHNTADSILFLTSARQALKALIGVSESADKTHVKSMQNFIMNEATDYEIMSLMMTGSLPNEKHNLDEEYELFDEFKDGILENYSDFSDAYGTEVVKSLVYEVGPVSQYGISTATPVLEHLYESGAITTLLEADPKKPGFIKRGLAAMGRGARTAGGKVAGAAKAGTTGAYQQIKQGVKDSRSKTKGATGRAVRKVGRGNIAKGVGKMLGTAAVTAAAIFAGNKIYKNYLSKAARACKGQGAEKAACMQNYRNQGIKAKIAAVNSGAAKCANTKNPEKCKAAIAKKVSALQSKLK